MIAAAEAFTIVTHNTPPNPPNRGQQPGAAGPAPSGHRGRARSRSRSQAGRAAASRGLSHREAGGRPASPHLPLPASQPPSSPSPPQNRFLWQTHPPPPLLHLLAPARGRLPPPPRPNLPSASAPRIPPSLSHPSLHPRPPLRSAAAEPEWAPGAAYLRGSRVSAGWRWRTAPGSACCTARQREPAAW